MQEVPRVPAGCPPAPVRGRDSLVRGTRLPHKGVANSVQPKSGQISFVRGSRPLKIPNHQEARAAMQEVPCVPAGVQGVMCRVQGAGCQVLGAGCRVQGAGCRVYLRGVHHFQKLPAFLKLTNADPFAAWCVVSGDATPDGIPLRPTDRMRATTRPSSESTYLERGALTSCLSTFGRNTHISSKILEN